MRAVRPPSGSQGGSSPCDWIARLVVHAHDFQNTVAPAVIDTVGRQGPASYQHSTAKLLLRSFEDSLIQLCRQVENVGDQLFSSAKIAFGKVFNRGGKILDRFFRDPARQRRRIPSRRCLTASRLKPSPASSDSAAASSPASSSAVRSRTLSTGSITYRPDGSARSSRGSSLPFQSRSVAMPEL